jgi:hypothetical protein
VPHAPTAHRLPLPATISIGRAYTCKDLQSIRKYVCEENVLSRVVQFWAVGKASQNFVEPSRLAKSSAALKRTRQKRRRATHEQNADPAV